jgi:hypothetical protein
VTGSELADELGVEGYYVLGVHLADLPTSGLPAGTVLVSTF